jgi:hypothetical protein
MTKIPTENRSNERRADWHTPSDCYKMLDIQTAMDGVNKRLDDGSARMAKIESTLDANHQTARASRKRVEDKLDANNEATQELLAIINMGKGFFRVIAWIGKWLRRIVLWTLPVLTAIIAFWYTLTGHIPPK